MMDERRIKGLCVIGSLITHHVGGVQRQVYRQTKEFVRQGVKVFVFQRVDENPTPEKSAMWKHVEFVSIGRPIVIFEVLWFILGGLLAFRRIRHDVDIIHAHQASSAALLAVLIKLFFGKPVVVKVTSTGDWGEIRQISSQRSFLFRRLLLRHVDAWIALTPVMKSEILRYFKIAEPKIHIIPNGVAVEARRHFSSAAQKDFTILYCGRLSIEKRLDTLILASDLLARATNKRIVLQFLGEVFKPRDPCKKLELVSRGLSHNLEIQYLGHHHNPENIYREATVFVLPSESEGMSNSLLEAMSLGVPSIVSDIPENRALIDSEESALVFEVGNSEMLFQQLMRVHQDRETHNSALSQSLANAAHCKIEKQYSVEAICSRLQTIYTNLVTHR